MRVRSRPCASGRPLGVGRKENIEILEVDTVNSAYSTSDRIDEILEVLSRILQAAPQSPDSLREVRISVVKAVASNRDIETTTVSSKFRREIGLNGTLDFDRVVGQWLWHGSRELEESLNNHTAYDPGDELAINAFFRRTEH